LAELQAERKAGRVTSEKQPTHGTTALESEVGIIDGAQLRINAVHEAGHAVMMTRIGHGLEVTTVDPQEVKRLTGRAMPGFTRPAKKGLLVEDYLCTTLAGVMSEAIFATNGRVSPAEDDFSHVEEILVRADIRGQERNLYREQNERRTRKLVLEYENEIRAVADALVARLTLTGEEVRTIVETVGPSDATRPARPPLDS
jgi:ATP-dependent Zn protease